MKNCYSKEGPRFSVVQGNIPQSFKWDAAKAGHIIEEYTSLIKKASEENPFVIFLPETAYPYAVSADGDAVPFADSAKEARIPLLVGTVYEKDGNYYNSAVLVSAKGKITRRYDKMHLVPFGEYIPFEKYLSPIRGSIDKPIGDFDGGGEYALFPVRIAEIVSDGKAVRRSTLFYRFGVLICFEDIFPDISREFVLRGADFLVNVTNDAWFGRTAAPEQHLLASVFRAVENRVPVIRAANTGVSCFIDFTGRVHSRVEKDGKDTFVQGITTDKIITCAQRSFYTIHGDIFILLSAVALVIFLWLGHISTSSPKRP